MASAAGKRKTAASAPVSAAKRTSGLDVAALVGDVIRQNTAAEIAAINARAAEKIAKASDVAARCAEIRAKADADIADETAPAYSPEVLTALDNFGRIVVNRAVRLTLDLIHNAANSSWDVVHVVPPMLMRRFFVMCPMSIMHLGIELLANQLAARVTRRYPVRATVTYEEIDNEDTPGPMTSVKLRITLYMFQESVLA